jgi:hypothetical protein
MPTTAPEAEAYAAASLALLALPLSTKDKHMILSASTTKLVSPESHLDFFVDCLYLDFGEKLSESSAAPYDLSFIEIDSSCHRRRRMGRSAQPGRLQARRRFPRPAYASHLRSPSVSTSHLPTRLCVDPPHSQSSASWSELCALLDVAIFEPPAPSESNDSQLTELKECLATMTSFPSAPIA